MPVSTKKMLFMVLLGSVLEAYDYALFGYFATLFAKEFFPALDPLSSLMMTFTVFAVGFLARPLGAAILGGFGDKYGRKQILTLSILLMALSTGIIGVLPNYAQIGIAAGLLLVCCRLIQGFAVGAEFVGAMLYMIEYAEHNNRALYGSLCISSGYLAMLVPSGLIIALTYCISDTTWQAWGWRVPFLLGLLLGLLGLYMRRKLPESPVFISLQQRGAILRYPLRQMLMQYPLTILQGMGLVILHALGFYLLFVYLNSFLQNHYNLPVHLVMVVNSCTIIMAIITLPLIGALAGKVGKKRLIMFSSIGLFVLAYPLFQLLTRGGFMNMLAAEALLTILLCFTSAVLPIVLAELFPASARYTGMAIAYNLSTVIFGGSIPLVLTFLVDKLHFFAAPSVCLMVAASITFMSTVLIKRRSVGELAVNLI